MCVFVQPSDQSVLCINYNIQCFVLAVFPCWVPLSLIAGNQEIIISEQRFDEVAFLKITILIYSCVIHRCSQSKRVLH